MLATFARAKRANAMIARDVIGALAVPGYQLVGPLHDSLKEFAPALRPSEHWSDFHLATMGKPIELRRRYHGRRAQSA